MSTSFDYVRTLGHCKYLSLAGGNQTEMGLDDTANSSMVSAHLTAASSVGTANSNNGFDFARTAGSSSDTGSRFAAKQTGMQRLTAFYRLFHQSASCLSDISCTTTLAQLTDILSSKQLNCDEEDDDDDADGMQIGGESESRIHRATTHLLNAFLVSAEFTEFSRSIHSKYSTKRLVGLFFYTSTKTTTYI